MRIILEETDLSIVFRYYNRAQFVFSDYKSRLGKFEIVSLSFECTKREPVLVHSMLHCLYQLAGNGVKESIWKGDDDAS